MISLIKVAQYALFSDDWHLDILVEAFLRANPVLKDVPLPDTTNQRTLAMAAALIELFALHHNQEPPAWSATIGEMPTPFFVWSDALTSPWMRQMCLDESPEPLKKRKIYAMANFLKAV